MTVDHCVVTFPQKREQVSRDSHVIGRAEGAPFFAAVVSGHGDEHLHPKIIRFSACTAGELARQFVSRKHPSAFPEIFDGVHEHLVEEFGTERLGAVAACVAIDNGQMTIAFTGNCRVYQFVPGSDNSTRLLTEDHCCDNHAEAERLRPFIQEGNFRSISHGPGGFPFRRLHRAFHGLPQASSSVAWTRGFGHAEFRPALTHEPEIRVIPIERSVPTLFALCSGGGDTTVRKTFKFLKKREIPVDAIDASSLADLARRKTPLRPDHDVTAIFLKLTP